MQKEFLQVTQIGNSWVVLSASSTTPLATCPSKEEAQKKALALALQTGATVKVNEGDPEEDPACC